MQLDLFESSPLKRCSRCRERKPLEAFSRNRSTKDGRQTYCKPCYNRIIREHRDRKYGGHKNFLLKLRYGIDEAHFGRLSKSQDGKCAICRTNKPKHVDHCHDSKRIRGLLCVNCNNGLGKFEDDAALMRAAVDYVERPVSHPRG